MAAPALATLLQAGCSEQHVASGNIRLHQQKSRATVGDRHRKRPAGGWFERSSLKNSQGYGLFSRELSKSQIPLAVILGKEFNPMKANRRSGFTLIATALCITSLLGMLGLAVDLGRVYIAKNEAQSFTDSAALA